ncbi:MAG: hypothetical protein OEV66_11105, partial [Spirochaetia bacterium]|nr:hypothetical protein [Spirochaetia bacterium]
RFNLPSDIKSDGMYLYVTEQGNHAIRKIDPTTVQVTTLHYNTAGLVDGDYATGMLNQPKSLYADGKDIYISDSANNSIRKISSGLHVLYTLDNGTTDISGNGSNAAFFGTQVTDTDENGTILGGYSLDGSTQYMTGPVLAQGNNVSLSAWIKPMVNTGTDQYIVQNGATISQAIIANGLTISGLCNGSFTPLSSNVLTLGKWSHVSMTITSLNQITVYHNGKSVTTGTCTAATPDTSLLIGKNSTGFMFNGSISNVRVYKRSLSTAEIKRLATSVPGGMVAFYPFTGDANDASIYKAVPTIAIATPALDRNNIASSAFAFNGTTDYISTSAAALPGGAQPRTLCAWTELVGSGYMAGYGDSIATTAFGIQTTGGASAILYDSTISSLSGTLAGTPVWTYICGTYDGSAWSIYQDGILIAAPLAHGLATDITLPFLIGKQPGGAAFYTGGIDDVRVYNRVLTLAEISALSIQ